MPSDPRLKTYLGIDIPSRPAGQRPPTAPPPVANEFAHYGLRFTGAGGFTRMAAPRIGNFTLTPTFGGLIPSIFSYQFHGEPDATTYRTTSGFPHPQLPSGRRQDADNVLKNLLLLIGGFVILALLWW